MPTFGEELNRLALTVSVVSEENWRDICDDLDKYFSEKVGASYWEISTSGVRVGPSPGLQIVKTNRGGEGNTFSLDPRDKKSYGGPRSYAYLRGQPLWIVDKQGKELCEKILELEDKWSDLHKSGDFPKGFPEGYDHPAKTILINPLSFQGNNFGVFILEHDEVKFLTPEVREEIEIVNQALSRIVRVWQTTKEQTDALNEARKRFSDYVKSCASLAEPKKIFVASPRNRDEKIWGAITRVLNQKKYQERFDVVIWDEMTEPGNIVDQIMKSAVDTSIGICLFAERIEQTNVSAKTKS